MLDLIGKKFNNLSVIKRVENTKHGKTKWLCKCDCGNTVEVVGSNLINGNTKGCGCLNYATKNAIDLTGKVYGKLTVINRTNKKKHSNYIWNCVCECGNQIKVKGSSLTTGNTLSCGCINKAITIARNKEHSGVNAYKNRPKGKAHYKWKNGVTPINDVVRSSIDYKEW